MPLITRQEKGSKLTIAEMDNNLEYLEGLSRPYKVYTALLSQSGTDDPVATVLENTIDADVTLSRMSEGYYKIDFVNITNTNRIFLYNGATYTGNQIYVPISDGGSLVGYYNISPDSSSSTLAVVLNTQDSTFANSEWNNIIGITEIPIEIRVYP